MALPFLRWPGGKRRMVCRIAPLVEQALAVRPKAMFVEPFLGAGAVALGLDAGVPRVLADACAPVVNVWTWVRRAPGEVHAALAGLLVDASPVRYDQVRRKLQTQPSTLDQAAMVLYLNALSFNGVWRVNSRGRYNVPFGDGVARGPTLERLVAAADVLRRAQIHCAQANHVIRAELGRVTKPVIYADPPYDGGFVAYTAKGFDPVDQSLLATTLHQAAQAGAAVITTNADTPRVRSLYAWANLEAIAEPRAVAANGDRRKPAPCLLITANVDGTWSER